MSAPISLRCPAEFHPLLRDIAQALTVNPALAGTLASLVTAGPITGKADGFGAWCKAARNKAGWSTWKLAAQAGLSQAQLLGLENGIPCPDDIRQRVETALGTKYEE